ncbi:hypothetical protein SUGI_0712030 [Cryptomeria japonica]|uniref:protein NRT1/ PTR FAMILY 5.2-like n=1 Tax=Cryptomeria japonica TaxID=3369 RepID=UPI0024148D5F|nr:protein NRT1/ PTR FAMILY 5.2-like [Cryptomeria japonica]GLJ35407.1 hypothetical protein SUGI_0712030 [Cryptomeria japonica]
MAIDEEGLVLDGSVDLRGKPVVREKTGGWRACSLIIGYEFVERMAFAGIWANLVVYLTTKLHEGTVSSARNVSNWTGATWLAPLLGAYIADTYWGRFWTFIIFSAVYIMGMGIMTLAVTLKSLRPPQCQPNEVCQKASTLQIGVFYFALYVLAIASGGTKPCISTIGADQFDEFHPKEKLRKNRFFNWWIFVVFGGNLVGQTFLVYIQDNISWGLAGGIMTAALVISYVLFMIGIPLYRHKLRAGSPLQRMAKVIGMLIKNWKVQVPKDASCLYEVDSKEYLSEGRYPIARTKLLRFMDKAAVQNTSGSSPCTVTDVEETKLMLRIFPIWLAVIFPSTLLTQSATLFVKQGMTLHRNIGPNFEIPAASIGFFLQLSMLLSLVFYDRILVPVCRRFTGNPRGITILQRMGIGMIIYTIDMGVAAITEMKRLDVIKSHGLADDANAIVPRSIFILLPQFGLMGIAETFLEVAKLEFFYDQAPESMQSLGTSLYAASLGVGAFLNSVILTAVNNVTGRKGHQSWILDNVNASRFHYYYAFLAIVNSLNFIYFLVVSWFYTYKREISQSLGEDSTKVTDDVGINSQNVNGTHNRI